MDTPRRFPVQRVASALITVAYLTWRAVVLFVEPKLQIGPDTTVVTGPVTANGRINFPAALHQKLSDGITNENNAAVLIDRAFGAPDVPDELRHQYFERLGINELPVRGDYVVMYGALITEKAAKVENRGDFKEKSLYNFSVALSRPWTREEFPLVAEWLDLNAAKIELIKEASERSRYYSPMVTSEGLQLARSNIQNLREASRLLSARAMQRLAADDIDGAWSDLLAIHRLASLAAQNPPDPIALLVGVALESTAAAGDALLISHGLTSEQARRYLDEHSRVPPIDSSRKTIDVYNRLLCAEAIVGQMSGLKLDVNVMLRDSADVHDQMVAALEQGTYAKRQQALSWVQAELDARVANAKHPMRLAARMLIDSRKARSEAVSATLLELLMPSAMQVDGAQVQAQTRHDLVQIGFALSLYKNEQGSYPKSLQELAPMYLPQIPVDKFTENPLIYEVRENGFLVYSSGPNQKDDGGRYDGQRNEDDISLEVPIRK